MLAHFISFSGVKTLNCPLSVSPYIGSRTRGPYLTAGPIRMPHCAASAFSPAEREPSPFAAVSGADSTTRAATAIRRIATLMVYRRMFMGRSVAIPHTTAPLDVKLVLDFRKYHPPVDGRNTAGSVLPSPS